MKCFKLISTLAVAIVLSAASMANGDDLWPVPNSPCPQAFVTAITDYAQGKKRDPHTGEKIARIRAITAWDIQGLTPGGSFVLKGYNKYGTSESFGVHRNLEGTANGSYDNLYDGLNLAIVRIVYYELWTADDRRNAVTRVLSSP